MTREEALNKVQQMSLPKETMEILEALAPELAESEDERIRKTLIDALKTSKSVGELKFILPEPTREECLAYLEKQGEQKVSVDDFKAKDWYVSKVDGKIHNIYYSVDKVKPKFKVGDKIIEKNFDECGRGTIIDIKDGKYIFDDGGFICIEEQGLWKLVEQKPAEYIKRNSKEWYSLLAEQYDKGFWKGKAEQKSAEWAELQSEFKNINEAFENGKKEVVAHPEKYDLCKPAEWSEKDEKMLQSIIKDFRAGKVSTIGQEQWLKSLPERFNLQPKQEWSEEDEEILKLLILNIGRYMYFGGMSSERILSFLKSLRPQPKAEWSEEEKEILDSILSHYVLIDKPIDANGIPKEKYISLIKSIRFDTYKNCNSHWKPNEEQMNALNEIANILAASPFFHQNDYLFNILNGLREELKKLL